MSGKGYGFAFLSGALLGAAAGLLFAPKKGEELRKELRIKGDEIYEKVASYDYAAHKEALVSKVGDFKTSLSDLDKAKVKDISLESLENLKGKADDLVSSAKKQIKKLNKKNEVETAEEVVSFDDEDAFKSDDIFDEL